MATTMPASPVRSKAISGSDRSNENKSFFDRRSLPSYQVVNSPIVSLPSRVVSASRNSFSMAVAADAARGRRARRRRGGEQAAPGEFRRCRRWCPRLGHAQRCGRSQEEQQGGCYPRHGPHGCKRVSTVQMQLPTGCSYENCTA